MCILKSIFKSFEGRPVSLIRLVPPPLESNDNIPATTTDNHSNTDDDDDNDNDEKKD